MKKLPLTFNVADSVAFPINLQPSIFHPCMLRPIAELNFWDLIMSATPTAHDDTSTVSHIKSKWKRIQEMVGGTRIIIRSWPFSFPRALGQDSKPG